MTLFRKLTSIAALLGAALPAAAQAPQAQADDTLFQRLDRDRDGYLSDEELQSPLALQGNWIAVDRDGDGRIARAEFGRVPVAASQAGAATGASAAGGSADPKPRR